MSCSNERERRGIVITGASSGIGRAIAINLAEHGYDLFLIGRSEAGLQETRRCALESANSGRVSIYSLDISQPGVLATLVASAASEHPYLFALINNAGVMHPEPILSGGRMDRWRAMMDVNYFAPLEGAVAAVQAMRAHRRPAHIINVSSTAADIESMGPYSASKKAQEIVSETLRLELQHDDIRVTTIVPGAFTTQLGRDFAPELMSILTESAVAQGVDLGSERVMGNPEHIARAVAYVLEQPASINIQRLVIRPPADLKL